MRVAAILPFLPAFAICQAQKPLKDTANAWYERVKSYVPGQGPVDAAAAALASKTVTELNARNWQEVLTPSPSVKGPENWMVLVTGGNKTCYGRCGPVETAWNKSAVVLAADPKGPKLGFINCEKSGVLCSTWVAGPPSIWYIELPVPAADQSKPATPIHVVHLNHTTITATEITAIHTKKTYLERPEITGMFHPFDSTLAKLNLHVPVGYILYAFGVVPSWALMLVISMVTRNMMNKKMATPRQQPAPAQGGAPAAGTR